MAKGVKRGYDWFGQMYYPTFTKKGAQRARWPGDYLRKAPKERQGKGRVTRYFLWRKK